MRTPPEDSFARRFFERQRQEIMARIEEDRRLRSRERWYGLALAAAALVLTAMVFTVIGGPAGTAAGTEQAWLAEADVGDSFTGEDPLAVFGSWDVAALGASSSPKTGEKSSLLPPLDPSAIAPAGDPLEWMPPPTGDEMPLSASPEQEQG